METILKVKNLNIEINKEKVISNLSFEVKRREILTILGPNGAGKTVLLRALLGLLPYRGEISWKKGTRISYLPQGLNQLRVRHLPISVREFFELKRIEKGETLKFLELVGINEPNAINKKIGDFSGGQFQRMLIAWVLASNPEVLLFDEPMAGIDIGGEKTIYSLLKSFWERKDLTILLVTHDLNIVYRYSDNVLCLSKKEGHCSGPPLKVLSPNILEKLYKEPIGFYKHRRHK